MLSIFLSIIISYGSEMEEEPKTVIVKKANMSICQNTIQKHLKMKAEVID